MLSNAVLLVVAVSGLALLLVVATATEEQEQGVEKKAVATTLADMAKLLVAIQKRVKALESSRTILIRGPRGLPGVRGPPGPKSGGVQYVRWGRTTCPYGATIVYRGRIGGEWYSHSGGGSNYVCLSDTPKYAKYRPGIQRGSAFMYGTEYEIHHFNPFSRPNLDDRQAPCAVCYVTTRSAKMMIPATYECPSGWTREYRGYLMTQDRNYKRTEFICVDQDAETVPGGPYDAEGALLYPVEGRCRSLPCSPFVEGRELTCAVCTK